MNRLLPILAFLLAACIAPASADPTPECCMPSPLDEFANSMRRIRNDDGSEVVSSSLVKLGPGLVASRANGGPGETTFATLDAPGVISQAAQIAALTARVTLLEAGGKWALPPMFVGNVGPESITLALGSMQRTNLQNYGFGDVLTATLPLVQAADVGRRIGLSETGALIGAPNGEIDIVASGGQEIDVGRVPPYSLAGTRPRVIFVAAEHSPGVYGWITESKDAD